MVAAIDDADDVLVVAHVHADLDSLGSGIALVELVDARVDLVAPDGVARRAGRLRDRSNVPVLAPDAVAVGDYDCVFVVDAPGSDRVAPVPVLEAAADGTLVVVDHHEPEDLLDVAAAALVEPDAPATATLVAALADEAGWELTPDAAFALVAGLLDDTGNLVGAGATGYRWAATLLSAADERLEELPTVLDRTPDFGERMARAKAIVRARGYRTDRTLVFVTSVGGHQTAAAHTLRNGGADVAVVLSDRDDRTWVTGRSSRRLDLDLPADVLGPLAEAFGGESGGHAGAGVAKLDTRDRDAVRERALELLSTALGGSLSALS